MSRISRIAFVSHLSDGYVRRVLAGACRFADRRSDLLIRAFPLPLRGPATVPLRALRTWKPDGILGCLMDGPLGVLARALPRLPLANCIAVPPRPGLARVLGCPVTVVTRAARHFRDIGIRKPRFLYLESGRSEQEIRDNVQRGCAAAGVDGEAFVEPVPVELLEDPDAPATPLPPRLAALLRGLPRPAGVFCFQLGGGNYLVRACRALGLRVPEDAAVIGVDDAEASLGTDPSLTSVLPAAEEVGTAAMGVLERMLKGEPAPRDVVRVAATELHVRRSTGCRAEAVDIPGALDFIARKAADGIGVEDVLQRTQTVSRMTFYREFRKATGESPGAVIRRRQIEKACGLLGSSELPVARISDLCGFSDASTFARSFRSVQGLSPAAYRERVRGPRTSATPDGVPSREKLRSGRRT